GHSRRDGPRGGAPCVGLTIGTDGLRGGGARTGTLGQHHLDQFAIGAGGRCGALLSRERRAGNWIPLPEGAAQLAVRETFGDRRSERPAELRIERVGAPLPAASLAPDPTAGPPAAPSRFLR